MSRSGVDSTGDPGRSRIRRQIATAIRVWTAAGTAGIADAAAARLLGGVHRWCCRDHELLGRVVELRGNWVRLDGCLFDVSHPEIPRALRARLLQGRYEYSERQLLKHWLNPKSPVIELGGGIGVVSTLVNRRLLEPAHHVVVEANPALIPVIKRQMVMNDAHFTVVNAALDYSGAATVPLQIARDFLSGRTGEASGLGIRVPAITLRQLLRRYPWTGATLICDVEGAETELVEREGELLRLHCDALVIEVHPKVRSAARCEALFTRLEGFGFRKVASVGKVHAFRV